MSIANISSPEDSYGRLGNLPQHERLTPTINQNFQERDISLDENYLNQNVDMNFQRREIQKFCLMHMMTSADIDGSLASNAGIDGSYFFSSGGMNSQEKEFSSENPLMQNAGIDNNYLMRSGGMNSQEKEFSGENPLVSNAGIDDNYLTRSEGMNSQEKEFSCENPLMPNAGIDDNHLMQSGGMNFQQGEFSNKFGTLENNRKTPSTSFGNPDLMRMSYFENFYKETGDSSQYMIVTPATNQNFQNGENEELLNHNQINDSTWRIGMKRRFEELDKSEAEKKGKDKQCNTQQSPMRKNKRFTKEELAEKKTGPQIRKDKETDMKSLVVKPWPVQPDVQGIQQEFQGIANANLEPEEDKEKSLEVASKFDMLQQQRKAHSTTAGNDDQLDYIVSHLNLYFQDSFLEKLKKQFSARSPSLLSAFSDLKHIVYDKGNNKVGKESFPGLQEELQKIGWEEVPSFLQSIASRIEKDRGIVTEFTYKPTQILVCAAIQEMENFPVENLDIDTLKKWGATLNKAKELGFQVGFADDLLRKNLLAYVAHTQILGQD
ncbi:hypothetical protein PVK06_042018 [Gossypium arboreum]|uniref:Uncharacterized protein n=1 Tax=Gossypium arboreum TaxID=29729 RepID=A0ABR0NCQ5_GOSAR|nr:hypothetical protein PVK06_042018 [Gossypium arboreum]